MGIRVTGVSTPVVGFSWEYTTPNKKNIPLMIVPGQKIKVFISSICGVEKYDKVRAELKSAIEATQLADVYTFENKGASTLSSGSHYTWALEDSDICIFLIDKQTELNQGYRPRLTLSKNIILRLYTIFVMKSKKRKPHWNKVC